MTVTTSYRGYQIKHLKSGKFVVYEGMSGSGLGEPNGTVYMGRRCSEHMATLDEAKELIDRFKDK